MTKVGIAPPGSRASWAQTSSAFCGHCVDGPAQVQRPLGRNGALVWICMKCDSGHPRDRRPVEPRGYTGPSSDGDMQQRIHQIAQGLPPPQHRGRNETMRQKTPGYLLVYVPVRDERGKERDRREAAQTISGKPWYGEARYLGNHRGNHVFERPDPTLAAKARHVSANPLAAIEIYRVGGRG